MAFTAPDNVKNQNFVSYFDKCECKCKNSGLTLYTFNLKTNKEVDVRKIDDLNKFLSNPPAFIRYKVKAIILSENVFKNANDGKKGVQERLSIAQKLSALNLPFLFTSNIKINYASILMGANVDLKLDETVMIINVANKNTIVTNKFIRKENGYLWKETSKLTIDPEADIKDTKDGIFGITDPKKIILVASHALDKASLKHIRAALKSHTVITLENDSFGNLGKALREIVNQIYDKNESKYYIIPQCSNVFGISEVKEKYSFDDVAVTNEINEALPFTRTIEVTREVKKFCLTVLNKTTKTFEPLDQEYVIKSDKRHKTKVTLTIDNNHLPSIQHEVVLLPEVKKLLSKLDPKVTDKIPIIGFFDNSSVICLWNEEKSCYKFSKLWNGKYGRSLFLDFSYEKPKLVDSINPSRYTFVVYDILKIMSFSVEEIKDRSSYEEMKITKDDENPVLLEFHSFGNTRKAASPAFLMALILKQHRKVIKKETGEKPNKLGFCIFPKSDRSGAGKHTEEGLEEACRLLKMRCTIVENQLHCD